MLAILAKLPAVIAICFLSVAGERSFAQPAAQTDDGIGKRLGLTAASGSLPLWTKPDEDARQSLGNFARTIHPAVILVGHPTGGHGTGFVISREHRLVVTNAHVADILHQSGSLLAIPDGTAQAYRVEKVWYHPGVRRSLAGDQAVVVRSPDPNDGQVFPSCPDLAVLQLVAEGPDLAAQFALATPQELASLFAAPVAMMGYPGHDTVGWPAIGTNATSTYYAGVVSRLSDFRLDSSVPEGELQLVQYTMGNWFGYSGSPVFLPNGHIVAINNMIRSSAARGFSTNIAHGVRVDCLRELLVHHGLDSKVPLGVDKTSVNVNHWLQPLPEEDNLRRAVNLVAEARRYVDAKENYSKAVGNCSEAIKLVPNYARAYETRSLGYRRYIFDNYRTVPQKTSLQQLGFALADAKKYMQLAPSDPAAFLDYGMVLNNTAFLTKNQDYLRESLAIANQFLGSDNLSKHFRARAHSLRAIAYSNLGQNDNSLREHSEALRVDPDNPSLWDTRADYWQNAGRAEEAAADKRRASELRARASPPSK